MVLRGKSNTNVVHSLLCVILVLLSGCKGKSIRRFPFARHVSPSGRTMAIVVGPTDGRNNKTMSSRGCYVYLIKLQDLSVRKVSGSENAIPLGMTWRNAAEEEVYFSKRVNGEEWGEMMGVKESGEVIVRAREADGLVISEFLAWSPNGEILAGPCAGPKSESEIYLGEFGLSWDKGKTVKVMNDIGGISLPPAWIDNSTLFIYQGMADRTLSARIVEVEIERQRAAIKNVVMESKGGFRLCGTVNRKCVYRIDSDLYCGTEIICADAQGPWVIIDDNIIAVETSAKVVLVDGKGHVLHEITLLEDQRLFDFHAGSNSIYLIETYERILRYDYTKPNEEAQVIFDVKAI